MIDLALSKMAFKGLNLKVLDSRNIKYQLHEFLMGGLGDMSSDEWTDRQTTRCQCVLRQIFFWEHKKGNGLSIYFLIRE
jgi:hypothetical protein